eukprot:850077-Alexandrium_andersonii.AAC.1
MARGSLLPQGRPSAAASVGLCPVMPACPSSLGSLLRLSLRASLRSSQRSGTTAADVVAGPPS